MGAACGDEHGFVLVLLETPGHRRRHSLGGSPVEGTQAVNLAAVQHEAVVENDVSDLHKMDEGGRCGEE